MTEIDATGQLFSQAATLLLVGMGFVFAFLSLLIFVIKIFISPLATRFLDPIPEVKNNTNTSITDSNQSAVVAAISVAIKKYRQKHK